MFSNFKRQRLKFNPIAATEVEINASLELDELQAEHEASMAEIVPFLERGYDAIAEAQAMMLRGITPDNPRAVTATMAVQAQTDLATKQLQMQAVASWGADRVHSALIRIKRSKVYV